MDEVGGLCYGEVVVRSELKVEAGGQVSSRVMGDDEAAAVA